MDADFDNIATSFEEEIYGSSKGFIRLGVLWEDLLAELPGLRRGGLSALDVGGGAGHVALQMARLGNRVVLCDPSREMLGKAEDSIREAGLSESVTTLRSNVQDLERTISDKFDVVVCHAVLEWLADPEAALGRLAGFLKQDGCLSLMFYNRNAALLKRIFRGEFDTALREHREGFSPRGWGNGATPLAAETVCGWLDELGLQVGSKAGIRIFHDHLADIARSREQLDYLLKVEKELRKQEPFASLGQHIHLVCERSR